MTTIQPPRMPANNTAKPNNGVSVYVPNLMISSSEISSRSSPIVGSQA